MWSVKDNGIWDISITDENGGTICHVNNKGDWFPNGKGDVSGRSHNEMISDAKLIAAAPEMALLIREAVNKGVFQGAMHRDAISILSRLTIFHGGEHDTSR